MKGAGIAAVPGSTLPVHRVGRRPGAPLSAYWLGQAGFLLETDHLRILIDAYLSDTLAEKYRGKVFPHLRMMPPPVDPATLRDLDLVLATHGHTDHLDPGTLAPVAHHNPRCRFVVPASSAALAISRGVPKERLLPANAFAALELPGVRILPLPSAHEELTIDAAGRHLFLGYLLELCGVSLYHPGDCVPYPGLLENLSPHPVDLALLPVNGRDKERTLAGVLGNFTLGEAISLTKACGFGAVVGHHFGLFDFNTIDPAAARAELHLSQGLPPFLLAEVGVRYDLWPRTAEKGAPKGDEKG